MKTHLVLLSLISTISLVSGCASSEQIQAQQRQYAFEREQQARELMNSYMKQCDDYGFKRGTTPFAQCIQQAEQQLILRNAIHQQQNPPVNWFKASSCFATGRLDCIP